MHSEPDTNVAIWQSASTVAEWSETAAERERRRTTPRRLMAELLPFGHDESFTFVDLGAGTGAAARAVLDRYPRASAILADYSAQMMAEGHKVLSRYEGRYRYVEFDLGDGRWPTELPHGLEAVISSLCVHHLPNVRKRELFGEIHERLAPGAWYFNYDPIVADDPTVERTWQRIADARDPAAAKKRAHRTPEQQARWENHIRHLAPLDPQLAFLKDAGFEAVDVYWKELDQVIYGGRRR